MLLFAQAIANLRFVYGRKILLVPIKEMVQALTVQKKTIDLKRGQWVRVKRGIYKGDLAQVLGTGDQQTEVLAKLIPRVDLAKIGAGGNVRVVIVEATISCSNAIPIFIYRPRHFLRNQDPWHVS